MTVEVIRSIPEVQDRVRDLRARRKSIGFVPTMGALHEGHLSLMRRSREENDVSLISIYVNPAQFGPGEDFQEYPRTFQEDLRKADSESVDILFTTTDREMYPEGYSTYVVEERMSGPLCGRSRPTFFRGVLTVVLKLFQITRPHRAYFGEKDYQQYLLIRKMAEELHLDVEVVPCAIVREPDGLAMSSRNAYLSPEEREEATALVRSLDAAGSAIDEGVRDRSVLRDRVERIIGEAPTARVDYVEVLGASDLEPPEILEGDILVALAVRVGKTRLIDNRVFRIP